MTSPEDKEDRLHPPGSAANWRESYYFNFHDEAGRAGLTYISLAPHQGTVDRFIMMLLPEHGRTLVSIRQDALQRLEDRALQEGALQYHCLEPLERWRLQAEADCLSVPPGQEISSLVASARTGAAPVERLPVDFDLRFERRTPAYEFPAGDWDFLGRGQRHFEQMGRVTGRMRIGDEEAPFDGMGGRDRSWGPREWLRAEWWNWINLQLEGDLFIGAVLSRAEGEESSSGFVYQDDLLQPIVQVRLEARRDSGDLRLLAGEARIVTERGQTYDLALAPISSLHIVVPRDENWQSHGSETLVTCRCEGRTGRGFVEHVRREPASPTSSGQAGLGG